MKSKTLSSKSYYYGTDILYLAENENDIHACTVATYVMHACTTCMHTVYILNLKKKNRPTRVPGTAAAAAAAVDSYIFFYFSS